MSKLIKSCKMKPGMVIGIKRNTKKYDDICLVLACRGFVSVEYTHLNLQDAFGDAFIGSIDGKEKIRVFKGKKRIQAIKKIKEDVFKWKHSAEHLIDMIRLIEAMDSKDI